MSWQTNQVERDLEKIIELTFTKLFLENVLYNYMHRRTNRTSVSRRMYEWERNADIRLSFLIFFFFSFFSF
jgi:hypothetical protein